MPLYPRRIFKFFLLLLAVTSLLVDCSPPVAQSNSITDRFFNDSFSPSSNNETDTRPGQGWTPPPNGRGTTDIIWSSCLTTILCCWTVLCLNVPPSNWAPMRRLYHKFLVFGLGIMGPEFHCGMAVGQWASARRSVKAFSQSGYTDWSMKHAFFADMGGFILHAPDFVPFPVNAKQVHYLVTQGHIPYSAVCIDIMLIKDKNKSDGMGRLLTILQVIWFSLNSLGRVIQGLAITTLELTTLQFILCSFVPYFFWLHKPMDVQRAITIIPNTTVAQILVNAGNAARNPYSSTPLDFVGRDLWSWNLYWTYWLNILGRLKFLFLMRSRTRPVNKIPDDTFPPWGSHMVRAAVELLGLGFYSAMPVFGWNFFFPTTAERILWRTSALTSLGVIVAAWIIEQYTWWIRPALKSHFIHVSQSLVNNSQHSRLEFLIRIKCAVGRLRNNSRTHDPAFDVPLKALFPMTALGFLYVIARTCILVEDVLSLRSLPPSAYDTVNWSGFLPHL